MALENFKLYQTKIASDILLEREANLVFVKFAHVIEELSAKVGSVLTYKKVGEAPLHMLDLDGTYDGMSGKDKLQNALGAPDTLVDSSLSIKITQSPWFNFSIGDIDEEFAKEDGLTDVSGTTIKKLGKQIAKAEDTYVRDRMLNEVGAKVGATVALSTTKGNANYIPSKVNDIVVAMANLEVDAKEVVCVTSPRIFGGLREALASFLTENNAQVGSNKVGNIYGIDFVETTLCNKDGKDYMFFFTKNRAVWFANGALFTESKRSDNGFTDIYRGYKIFGAELAFPREVMYIEASSVE